MTSPSSADSPHTARGASAIAGAILLRNTLARADLDERTKALIAKQLHGLLPGQVIAPGAVTESRTFSADDLDVLVPSAAVTAAGLDPSKTASPAPPVLWENAGNRLIVQLAGVKASLDAGLVEFTIPVRCDQTGDTSVTITFVTGTADRPAGGLATTESHPRGAAVIVENWHEQLIAFAWSTLLVATSALTGVTGSDPAGKSLITGALYADAAGLGVLPMARHTFVRTDASL